MTTKTLMVNSLRLTPFRLLLALLIVALAFALRLAVVVDRAQSDERFYPPQGNDIHTYVQHGQILLDGNPTWIRQPGVSYAYAALMGIMGRSQLLLMLAMGVLDALVAGLMIACGVLLTRRWWAGVLAGAMYAAYPVSVFFAGTLLADPFATALLVMVMFLWLLQRERLSWPRTLLLGLLMGYLVVTRNNLVPVAILMVLYLL